MEAAGKKPVHQPEKMVSHLSTSTLPTLEEDLQLKGSENECPVVVTFNAQNESESKIEREGNKPAEEYATTNQTRPAATAPLQATASQQALAPQLSSYAYTPDAQMQHVHGIQYSTAGRQYIEIGMHPYAQQIQHSPDLTCIYLPFDSYMTQSPATPVFYPPYTSVPITAYPSTSYPSFSMQPHQVIAPPSSVGSFMYNQQQNYFEQHPRVASTTKKVRRRVRRKKATHLECYSGGTQGSTRETVEDKDFIIDVEGLERLYGTVVDTDVNSSTDITSSDLEEPINMQESQAVEMRTTLMIKNIPNRYSKAMLLAEIDQSHSGTYNFFYLPIDQKNACNAGYAFINFNRKF